MGLKKWTLILVDSHAHEHTEGKDTRTLSGRPERQTNDANHQLLVLHIDAHQQRVVHDVDLFQEECVIEDGQGQQCLSSLLDGNGLVGIINELQKILIHLHCFRRCLVAVSQRALQVEYLQAPQEREL